MSDQVLTEISKKLDHLVVLFATSMVKGMKANAAILALDAAGLDRNLIAQVVGTSPSSVRARLSEARLTKKTEPKKGEKPND